MPVIESQVDTLGEAFVRNRADMLKALAGVRAVEDKVRATEAKPQLFSTAVISAWRMGPPCVRCQSARINWSRSCPARRNSASKHRPTSAPLV